MKTATQIFNEINNNRSVKWGDLSDGGKWNRAIEAIETHGKQFMDYISELRGKVTKLEEEVANNNSYAAAVVENEWQIKYNDLELSFHDKVKQGVEAIWERDFYKNKVKEQELELNKLKGIV